MGNAAQRAGLAEKNLTADALEERSHQERDAFPNESFDEERDAFRLHAVPEEICVRILVILGPVEMLSGLASTSRFWNRLSNSCTVWRDFLQNGSVDNEARHITDARTRTWYDGVHPRTIFWAIQDATSRPCSFAEVWVSPTADRMERFLAYGCRHYQRGCKIKSTCCHQPFSCRHCHDAQSDHRMIVEQTEMFCLWCGTLQPCAGSCANCGIVLGAFYCGPCRMWDNNLKTQAFHCDDCGLCRVGRRDDYFHCASCSMCISVALRRTHVCKPEQTKNPCAHCLTGGPLWKGTFQVTFLPCGDAIHVQCCQKLMEQPGAVCPTCKLALFP